MSTSQSRARRSAEPASPNHYKLLGVQQTATFAEITTAYRAKMKQVHPDRQRPERRAAAEERAKELNLAYQVLSRSESRRAYDSELKAAAIQDEIMNRYVGGFVPSGAAGDPFAEALRRERSAAEKAEQRRADRSATANLLIVFAGIALVAIALLLVWAAISTLISALL